MIACVVLVLMAGIGTGIKFGGRNPEVVSQMEIIGKRAHEREQFEHGKGKKTSESREHDDHRDEHEMDWENMIFLTNDDKILIGIIAGAFFILLGAYWFLTTAYAVCKASQAGLNPYIFGTLTFVFNLFGVAIMWIWILVHPICPECGKSQVMKASFCSFCGEAIYRKCPDCGESLSKKDVYCHGCGKKCVKEEGDSWEELEN